MPIFNKLIMTKQCVTCLVVQPLSNYYKRGERLYTSCKTCEAQKRQAHYSANNDRIKKRKKEVYQANEDVSERAKEYARNKRARRSDEEHARDNLYMKEYKRKNPEKIKQLNSKNREMHRNNFIDIINPIIKKKGGACKDCANSDMRVLEFDHLDPEDKSFNVSFRHNRNASDIEKEAEKTELVCVNCHRLRTSKQYTRNSNNAKKKFRDQAKLERASCESCKLKVTSDNLAVFDFDHLDRSSKIACISLMCQRSHYSVTDVEAEMTKCRMLCANCHKIHTRIQLNFQTRLPHAPWSINRDTCVT
jgi:hypothetical protein